MAESRTRLLTPWRESPFNVRGLLAHPGRIVGQLVGLHLVLCANDFDER